MQHGYAAAAVVSENKRVDYVTQSDEVQGFHVAPNGKPGVRSNLREQANASEEKTRGLISKYPF